MDVPIIVAIVGVAGTAFGIGLKVAADTAISARAEGKKTRESAATFRNLYRNAFMQLNNAMRIGYVDSIDRFREVLQLAVDRASSNDISSAFPPKAAEFIHNSIPALVDSLYGCIEAQKGFNALPSIARENERARSMLFERVRESANVGLALVTVVLTEIGDDAYVAANLTKLNGKRIIKYLNDERELVAAENQREANGGV
jgi:hypothetical protein